jgi:ABC-type glycerol-3-phosphate transport system substrate-binding protein
MPTTNWLYDAAAESGFEIGATLMPKGPAKHGGFANMHHIGIHSDAEHPQESWEYIKFFTGEEMGVPFWEELGHHTPRISDWENPALIGKFEVYEPCRELMKNVPLAPVPWNLRGKEMQDELVNGMQGVFLGDISLEEGLSKTSEAITKVLGKTMLE